MNHISFVFPLLRLRRCGRVYYIIYNVADSNVSVATHDFNVVEDRAVGFHRLPRAVFKNFEWCADVEAMLDE